MYLTELEINRQRYGLELTRLRNLLKRIVDDKRQELDQASVTTCQRQSKRNYVPR